MRIAISSRSFRRPLAERDLTQLEWLERCAAVLDADGVVADVSDFPRTDTEYVAQLRKVAIDLGLVPFGVDAPAALDPQSEGVAGSEAVALAVGFGAALIRTAAPPPGEIPPATFAATVLAGKQLARAAKAANVTVAVTTAADTLGADLAELKHLLKDIDSAWLRACPAALEAEAAGPKDHFPARWATTGDDAAMVVRCTPSGWLILDAVPAPERPWDVLAAAVRALRVAEAELRLGARI
jgi:hypothetical protein